MLESSTWYSRMPAFTIGVVRYCGRETASIAELRECRIRVNAISPGNINAPIFEGWQQGDGLTKMKEELAKNVPLGRLEDPDEIAKAVAFLASDEASYIAGIDLTVHKKGSNMIMPADCQGGFASFDTRPSHDQLLFEVSSDIKRLSKARLWPAPCRWVPSARFLREMDALPQALQRQPSTTCLLKVGDNHRGAFTICP